MNEKRNAAYRRSIIAALSLAVLTVIEYFAAVSIPVQGAGLVGNVSVLMLLAVIKGLIVLYMFMHVSRLWTQDGGH